MRNLKVLLLLVAIITIQSCKKSNGGSENSGEVTTYEETAGEEGYPDGTYCADIDYYNPDTGTSSTYTLNVEVESNEVTVLHWPNGGWLDSTHFSPEALDSSGSCSFTSYEGKQYDIQITGAECSFTDSVSEDESLSNEDNSGITNDGTSDETSDDGSTIEE